METNSKMRIEMDDKKIVITVDNTRTGLCDAINALITYSRKHSYLREPHNPAIQVLSDVKLPHTNGVNRLHELDQQKSSQSLVPTSLRFFHLVRTADNKLLCLENDRMLPLTNQGEIDSDQLAREIASRIW